jgi:hypothetical protein
MIGKDLYEKVMRKYGYVASWAVWEEFGQKPKSNMGYKNIFDFQKNPNLLTTLRNDVLMIGLNFSRPLEPTSPFQNFHDESPYANDFKIRYAFHGTCFYGAYMTDIIKNMPEKSSGTVMEYLCKNSNCVTENIAAFREEIRTLESSRPTLLAFGRDAYDLLKKNLKQDEYSQLIKLTHYSHQVSKEEYKAKTEKLLGTVRL